MQERIDAFFEFIYDRQEIWHKRSYLKQPAPWTSDPILNTYKFCNVYRELDAGTQAVCRYLQNPKLRRRLSFLTSRRTVSLTAATQSKSFSAG